MPIGTIGMSVGGGAIGAVGLVERRGEGGGVSGDGYHVFLVGSFVAVGHGVIGRRAHLLYTREGCSVGREGRESWPAVGVCLRGCIIDLRVLCMAWLQGGVCDCQEVLRVMCEMSCCDGL